MILSFLQIVLLSGMVGAQTLSGSIQFFHAPQADAHRPIIDALNSANSSINMAMYHLSDPEVAKALEDAAGRGVKVRLLADKGEWKNKTLVDEMTAGGVNVKKASKAFSITHEKSMVIDDQTAVISTMNQITSTNYIRMLDEGIIINDPGVIAEFNHVFDADWTNADNDGEKTPELSNPNLVWSPKYSAKRIVDFIDSANSSIDLTVENLSYDDIIDALIKASGRGVAVRVIVPKCVLGVNGRFNYPHVQKLVQGGVNAHMMPGPSSEQTPYVHAKTIVVDHHTSFLGSENFTFNSLEKAREVGIIVEDNNLASEMEGIFEQFWPATEEPPADANYSCKNNADLQSEGDTTGLETSTWLSPAAVQPKTRTKRHKKGTPDQPGFFTTASNILNQLMIQSSKH